MEYKLFDSGECIYDTYVYSNFLVDLHDLVYEEFMIWSDEHYGVVDRNVFVDEYNDFTKAYVSDDIDLIYSFIHDLNKNVRIEIIYGD